jgi:hypothetical protein
MRKFLEGFGVRIKGTRAVKFRQLANVAEIVVGQFVEQLRHAYRPHLVVAARASGRGGDGVQEDNVCAAPGDETFQMLTSSLLMDFAFGRRDVLCQRVIVLHYDAANPLAVELFGKMRQDLLNRSTLRRRFPLQYYWRSVMKKLFETPRHLLEQGN